MKKRVLAILLAASLVAGTGWGNGCVYAASEIPDKEAGQETASENTKISGQQKETLEVSEQQCVSDEGVENNNKENAEKEQVEGNSEKNVKKEQTENNSKENVQTRTSVEEDTKEEAQESGKDSAENEAQVEVVTEEIERNGSSNAVRINPNSVKKDALSESCDEKNYYFTINSAGVISLSFGKGYDSEPDHGWNITLYDSSQNELMSREYSCNNTETETTCKIGVPAGTYYIKVERRAYTYQSDATYSLKVNYSASSTWESEFNNEIGQADLIAVGTYYSGTIMEDNDIDYYRFTVPKTSYVNISAKGEYDSDTYHCWQFCVYNASMVEQQQNLYYCGKKKTENYEAVRLPAGTYYLKVNCYNGNRSDKAYSFKINTTFTKTNTKLSTANTGSGIKLSWNRVSEGSGYKVYRKTGNGSYSLIKTIENNKTTSFTDKSVKKKNGTKYTYMVRAYKGSGQNACSGKVIYRLTAPAKPEVKNSKGKKITVKWKKNTSASGYQVKFVNGSKSRTKTFSGQKSVKKTVSGFQKGKTYKVYVRSYKKVSNKKYYSAWSAARSVKVKK